MYLISSSKIRKEEMGKEKEEKVKKGEGEKEEDKE